MSRESTKISCEATKDPLVTELSITDELQLTEVVFSYHDLLFNIVGPMYVLVSYFQVISK